MKDTAIRDENDKQDYIGCAKRIGIMIQKRHMSRVKFYRIEEIKIQCVVRNAIFPE